MMRVATRRFFSTLPTQTKLKDMEEIRDTVPPTLINHIKQLIAHEKKIDDIEFFEHHAPLSLNFAQWTNGRMPVIQATYEKTINLSFLSQSALALVLIGSLAVAPSMYFAGGAFGYGLYVLNSNSNYLVERFSGKITSVDLLEDDQLQVSVQEGKGMRQITIPKSEFKYGQYLGANQVWYGNFLQSHGLWCSVGGKNYLLGGERKVNQHFLNEIL